MNSIIEQMLTKYELNSDYDRINAMKEVMKTALSILQCQKMSS